MSDDIIKRLLDAIAAGPRPGEWRVSKYRDGRQALIYDADDFEVARVCYPNRDADAALIAACSPANMTAILAHIEAQAAENERLRKFVGRVLGEARQYMSDIDGGDVQAWAVECGLLEEWTATEPCGEQCECAEVADFPTRCYRLTETGKAAIDAAKEEQR